MYERNPSALVFLAALMLLTALAPDRAAAGGPPAVTRAAHEERRILVAFHDGTIGRIPIGDSTGNYRPRGHYRSSTWGSRSVGDLAEQYRLETMEQWPIPVLGMHCAVYRVPPHRSVEQTLVELSRDDRIELAEPMRIFHAQADTKTEAKSDPYERLQSSLSGLHLAAAHRYATGRNVEVAVIDTGIDANHPDLRDQVVEARNFTLAQDTNIADIHGTAVAGIIAAIAGNSLGISGVAPGAKILSLKACWPERANRPEAICDTFTLAQALNTAIERKTQVVNLSLAGPRDRLLEMLIVKGVADGVIFVSSIPPDGSPDFFPASVPGVIAVRSLGSGPTSAAPESHEVSAPGTELLTTLPQGTYNFVTGSSYATAVVSGLIALLLEDHPKLDTHALIDLLQNASMRQAEKSGSVRENLDACGALARLEPSVTCPASKEPVRVSAHIAYPNNPRVLFQP